MSELRLFIDAPLAEDAPAPLSAEQAHYLKNVMRRGEGDRIFVFNARDGEFEATLASLTKKGGEAVVGARARAPEAGPDLWLLVAPVKRAAFETIVQKATELGVSRLVPVETERVNAQRINRERLAAIAVEAAEQCGRLSVPNVDDLSPLERVLGAWPSGRRLLFCDEAGEDPAEEWGGCEGRAAPVLEALADAAAPSSPWAILIGPEGGFSPHERGLIRAKAFTTPATLGPRILRADTAAIVAVALWQAALGDLKRT